MGEVDILKAVAGLLSALGAIAVYKFNLAQSYKVRAELLERLDAALANGKKHVACELFRILHGLRMDYEDIYAICTHDKVSKIVLALQKTPGLVKHEGGRLQYTTLYGKKWVRRTNKVITRGLAYFLGALTFALIILMATAQGTAAIAILAGLIPCVAFFAMQIKDLRHDIMIESLVSQSET